MKTIRYTAASLLLLTGLMHAYYMLRAPHESNSIGLLIFGIVFMVTAIFVYLDSKLALYAGILIPFIGGVLAITDISKHFSRHMLVFLIIDILIILCLLYVLLRNKNVRSAEKNSGSA